MRSSGRATTEVAAAAAHSGPGGRPAASAASQRVSSSRCGRNSRPSAARACRDSDSSASKGGVAMAACRQKDVRHRQLPADGRIKRQAAGDARRPGQRQQHGGQRRDACLQGGIAGGAGQHVQQHGGFGERLVGAEAGIAGAFVIIVIAGRRQRCDGLFGDVEGKGDTAQQVAAAARSGWMSWHYPRGRRPGGRGGGGWRQWWPVISAARARGLIAAAPSCRSSGLMLKQARML